jgi:hypothetical protein
MLRFLAVTCLVACTLADSLDYPKSDYYGGCGKWGCTYGYQSHGLNGNYGGLVSTFGSGISTGFVGTGGLNTGMIGGGSGVSTGVVGTGGIDTGLIGGGSAAASAAAAGNAAASAAAAGGSAAASAAAAGGLGWNAGYNNYWYPSQYYNFPGQYFNFPSQYHTYPSQYHTFPGQYHTFPGHYYNSGISFPSYGWNLGSGSAAASAAAGGIGNAAAASAASAGGFNGFNGGVIFGGSRRSFGSRRKVGLY